MCIRVKYFSFSADDLRFEAEPAENGDTRERRATPFTRRSLSHTLCKISASEWEVRHTTSHIVSRICPPP